MHKKYSYHNGKKYGPYYYENKRVNGKVVTTYLGADNLFERRRNNFYWIYAVVGLLFVFSAFFIFSDKFELGVLLSPAEPFSVSLSQSTFEPGEKVVGELNLQLSEGELIPSEARVVSDFNGVEKSFSLSELAENDYELSEGNFYLENSEISGFGRGYGLIGYKETFPEVSFQIKITKPAETDVGNGGGGGATEVPGEIPTETPAEVPTKIPEEIPSEQPGEIPTGAPEEVAPAENQATPGETASETGGDISSESGSGDNSGSSDSGSNSESSNGGNSGSSDSGSSDSSDSGSGDSGSSESSSSGDSREEPSFSPEELFVEGTATKENSFNYDLETGWKAEIVSGSVKIDGEAVDDGIVKLEEDENSLVVSTEYSVLEEGFGQEFLGDEVFEMTFNLDKFEFTASEENSALDFRIEYEGQNLFETSENVVSNLPEENVTGENETVDIPIVNETVEIPMTNETFGNETNVTQPQIVLGQPVVWTKRIDAVGPATVTVELPNSATVLSVKGIKESVPDVADEIPEITQEQVVEPEIISKEAVREGVGLEKVKPVERTETADGLMLSPSEMETREVSVEIAIGERGAEIKYSTPAAEIISREITRDRIIITVSAPDLGLEYEYKNVLIFENIPAEFEDKAENAKVYWREGEIYLDSGVEFVNGEKRIEFIAPHLSNQTFEIILITKAEHLDENRTFVEDIYDFVKARDENWTTIPGGDYLRVNFEQNLTYEKDITIYARSSANATVEVYEENGTELIADFGNIGEDKKYQIFLSNLVGEQDTFDLFVDGGDVEFDYVVDPTLRDDTTPPSISFVSPTPQDGSTQPANSIYVNVSSTDEGDHYTFVDFDRSNVLWMRMDDVNSSGDPIDLSSYSNNGTSGFSSQVDEGYFGKGFNFSSGGHISTNGAFSSVSNISIAIWAHPQTYTYTMQLASQGGMCNLGEFKLYRYPNGNITFSRVYHTDFADGGITTRAIEPLKLKNPLDDPPIGGISIESWTTSSLVSSANWSHIALVYDQSGSVTFYINGIPESPTRITSTSGMCEMISNSWRIGRSFNGTLDEVIFYKRVLSSSEVLSLYNASASQYGKEFTSLNLGEHTATGFAVDKAGLKSQTETRHIFISNEFIPYTKLNLPADKSEFDEGDSQINLDADVYDPNNDTIDVLVYGVPQADLSNFYNYLLYKKEEVNNGTKINYNFVSVPVNPSSAGLVGLWHFDNLSEKGESENKIIDWSGAGNNLTRVGNVEYNLSGKFGYSTTFDGDEYLYAPDSPSLSGLSAVTVSAWIKVENWSNSCLWYLDGSRQDCYNYIVAKSNFADLGNEYRIRYENGTSGSKIVAWFITRDGFESGSSQLSIPVNKISVGNWHLLVGTWYNNTGEMNFYLDGNLENSTIFNAPKLHDGITNFSIGAPGDNTPTLPPQCNVDNLNGSIDEVAVWNRALNETEVKDLYRLKAGRYFWKVNVTDEFGNNNESETREFNITGPIQIAGCGELNKTNKVYELQGDLGNPIPISGTCFNITADNVTLDGKGYVLTGNGAGNNFAVFASGRKNLLIKNLNTSRFDIGIYLNYTNFSRVENTASVRNSRNSIYLENSFYNSVKGNIARDNKYPGIRLKDSSHNIVDNNLALNSTDADEGNGIRLLFGINNTISRNIVLNNSQQGIYFSYGTNNTISRNIVRSNSKHGIFLSQETGDKILDNIMDSNYVGLYLGFSRGCNISNASISSSSLDGLYLDFSSNNILSNIVSANNIRSGIYFVSSSGNNFSNIDSESNSGWGIYFSSSSNNSFYSGIINGSKSDAIHFSDVFSYGNIFSNISIRNTISSKMDVYFAVPSINGTQFIDSFIGNYSFAGSGGTVIFKNSQFGEIRFLQPINGAGTNLSNDVRIGNNSAVVLSNVNLGLNKSANITLYGIGNRGFSNPGILRDSLLCPVGICYNFTSLTAENVSFNVTGWTEYRVGEDYIPLSGCGDLGVANKIYKLTNDLSGIIGSCFIIKANNVTLDGMGHMIKFSDIQPPATGYFGISNTGGPFSNVQIRNLSIVNFGTGIYLNSFLNTTIYSVSTNYSLSEGVLTYGISLENFHNGKVINTRVGPKEDYGISLDSSNNTELINVTSLSNDRGILLVKSSNNLVSGGLINGTGVTGVTLQSGIPSSRNNTLRDISVKYTSITAQDLEIASGSNGTYFINMNLSKYDFSTQGFTAIFEDTRYGKVSFLIPINGTGANLNYYVKIENNSVFVDSLQAAGLNRSANITLYGIGNRFAQPVILRDGIRCGGICYNFTSLTAENVSFNVTGWTEYKIGRNNVPYTVLNGPANDTDFEEGILNITLNVTVFDLDNDTIDFLVYGVDEQHENNFYNYLLYRGKGVLNGTNFAYNWTSPVVTPDASTILLMHFDNRSSFGENGTFVRDFSGRGNNGTVSGNTIQNASGGKIGGAFEFDGYQTSRILVANNPDFDIGTELTLSTWMKFRTSSKTFIDHDDYGLVLIAANRVNFKTTNSTVNNAACTSSVLLPEIWYHVAATYNGTAKKVYINGEVSNTCLFSGDLFVASPPSFTIGGHNQLAVNSGFNGTLDEVAVWNRALNDSEIKNLYRLKAGRYFWKVNVTDSYGGNNESETREFTIAGENLPPIDVTPRINSTNGSNRTIDDLNCIFTPIDPEGNSMEVSVRFYKNGLLNYSYTQGDISNGSLTVVALGNKNTTKGENWRCGIRSCDTKFGNLCSNWVNSTDLMILNTPPYVILNVPLDNETVTNRTTAFSWRAVDDDDSEIPEYGFYQFNISCYKDGGGTCSSDDRNRILGLMQMNNVLLNYSMGEEFQYLDEGYYYNWSVRANDSEAWGPWSEKRRLNVQSLVSIILLNSTVDFGSMIPGESNSTDDNSPLPLLLQNTGNVLVNVTLNASDLWLQSGYQNPTQYYLFKIDNESGALETSFNVADSVISWTPVPNPTNPLLAIVQFKYNETYTKAEVDLNITVPSQEPPGQRNSTLTFIARRTS